MEKKFSHTDNEGRARMVDIGAKDAQFRFARASGFIQMGRETLDLIRENAMKKGDVLTVAEIAGVQAAKMTGNLIPLCHNIPLEKVKVTTHIEETGISVVSEVSCTGKTGVEMEALTAVSVALLTVYDMCKSAERGMVIEAIRLEEKAKKDLK